MRQERYVVLTNDQSQEVSWHRSLDKACAMADRYAAEDDRTYRVDWALVDITRDGVECIDADPDLYATAPRRES